SCLNVSTAFRTASSEGCKHRAEIAIEVCPAMRASTPAKPGEECVSQAVQRKRNESWILSVLCSPVPLYATRFDVTALGRRRPNGQTQLSPEYSPSGLAEPL